MIRRGSASGAVLCIGRLYCDIVFSGLDAMPQMGREVFSKDVVLTPGGGAYIAAAWIAGAGRQAALVSRIGTDTLSTGLLEDLASSHVDLRFLDHAADAGPQLTVVLTGDGDRAFISRRQGPALPATLAAAVKWNGATHLHIAEYATLHEIPDLIAVARDNGLTVSIDPSWDSTLVGDPAILKACAGADVFLPNEAEAMQMTGAPDIDRALDILCDTLPCAVIKAGPRGAIMGRGAGRWSATATAVTVRDTTGAGDAFNAGFLDAWLDGETPQACLDAGVRLGSLSVQEIGGTRAIAGSAQDSARAKAMRVMS